MNKVYLNRIFKASVESDGFDIDATWTAKGINLAANYLF